MSGTGLFSHLGLTVVHFLFDKLPFFSMRLPKMPRILKAKFIRSKLASARLLGGLVRNSLTFKIKRRALRRFRTREFDTVIVDMDGTLFSTDANLEALSMLYPEANAEGRAAGEDLYDSIISKIASGEYTIERAIVEGNKFLIAKKMSRQDFSSILAKVEPTIKKKLVGALKSMKASGKKLVLATLSSKDFGDVLNSHLKEKYSLGFDFVVGTKLRFDQGGLISGLESIVGTKDFEFEGIPVRSKLTAIREAMAQSGAWLDINKSLLITDSYGDIDLAKTLVTVLIRPKSPSVAQKVSYRLKLADYILKDDKDLQTNLESIILGSEK